MLLYKTYIQFVYVIITSISEQVLPQKIVLPMILIGAGLLVLSITLLRNTKLAVDSRQNVTIKMQ